MHIELLTSRVQVRDDAGRLIASLSIEEAFELAVWVRERAYVLAARQREDARRTEREERRKDV